MKMGEKLLDMPKTCGDCYKIYEMFNIQYKTGGPAGEMLFPNAYKLVEINNEIYNDVQNKLYDNWELLKQYINNIVEKSSQEPVYDVCYKILAYMNDKM